jgi:hypothetical protein
MSNEVGGTFPTGSKTIRNGRLDFHHETLAGRCGSVAFTNPDRSSTSRVRKKARAERLMW